MQDISKTISTYVHENFIGGNESEFNRETPLLSSGIIDSISALELVDFLETTFKLEFKPHEVDQDNLNTVALMENFVLAKQAS